MEDTAGPWGAEAQAEAAELADRAEAAGHRQLMVLAVPEPVGKVMLVAMAYQRTVALAGAEAREEWVVMG
jgi:hypothetical protein